MNDIASYLYQALGTERGIVLLTPEPHRLIPKLQQTRRDLKDPSLDALVIAVSRTNPDGEVWIVHQPTESEEKDAAQESGPA